MGLFKRCNQCGKEKATSEFYKDGQGVLYKVCKTCSNLKSKEHYRENKVKRIKQVRAWEKLNPEKVRNYHRKKKYNRRQAIGTFTSQQLEDKERYWGGKCYICGGKANSVDHVKPLSKGGSNWPCNLRPCCTDCNSRKNNYWPKGPIRQKLFLIYTKVLGGPREVAARRDPLATRYTVFYRKMVKLGYYEKSVEKRGSPR